MTFRPAASRKPTRRRTRRMDSRRSLYLNILFGVAVVVSVALLGSVVGINYYGDHGASVASVNGVAISKDAVRARAAVDLARYQRQIYDYGQMRNGGKISTTDYSTLTSAITSNEDPSTLYSNALTELTQEYMLQQYADKNGITVSDADVQAQITKDATIPELRHVKVIGVQATPKFPAPGPTQDVLDAARAQAQTYLTAIQGGTKWDDEFKVSTQDYTPSGVGDLGLMSKDSTTLDPDITNAIFALKNVNDMTAVYQGQDGIFRFATITAIVPATVDSAWESTIASQSSGDEYHRAARGEAIKAAIQVAIEKKYVTSPQVSRHVLEIFVAQGVAASPGSGDEVKVRIIIFAPGHSASSAAGADDAAWSDAQKRANDAYAAIQKDPTQFGVIASDSKQNDDPNLQYLPNGDYPWLPSNVFSADSSQGGLGMGVTAATIYKPDLPLGLMAPIREPGIGYVLVDFQGSRAPGDQRIADAQLMLHTGLDFSTVASQFSEMPDAAKGGDLGWVSQYRLSSDMQAAIFQVPVGGVTRVVATGSGYWIFKVTAEETRIPDAPTQLILKQNAFNMWLNDLTSSTNIWKDSAGLTAITPTATP
jgi:parvulin-like peptidyl-prolyl isomerase